jgi:hypothetical protein
VLYGLFGGIALILFLLLMLSPSPKTTADMSNWIPEGCSVVSGSGIDPETQLPRQIEVSKLKDVEPLRLVLIKPRLPDESESQSNPPRLGERISRNMKLEPFYIAEKEVSVVQFEYLSHATTTFKDESDINKVKSGISHKDAEEFCTMFGGNLPTEDQWETATKDSPVKWPTNLPGTVLQWCSENYKPGFGETSLDVSAGDYLVKGISPLMFTIPERRIVWRAPAHELGAPDIGFRPVVMPNKESKRVKK